MNRLPLLVATLGVSTALLAGCGGGTDEFCKDLRSAKDDLGTSSVASADFQKTIDRFDSLAEEAPDDVKSDWRTLSATYTKIGKTFEDAGVTPEVLEQLQQGKQPKGVTTEDIQKVATSIQSVLGDTKFQKAQENVTKDAESTCDVKLTT